MWIERKLVSSFIWVFGTVSCGVVFLTFGASYPVVFFQFLAAGHSLSLKSVSDFHFSVCVCVFYVSVEWLFINTDKNILFLQWQWSFPRQTHHLQHLHIFCLPWLLYYASCKKKSKPPISFTREYMFLLRNKESGN